MVVFGQNHCRATTISVHVLVVVLVGTDSRLWAPVTVARATEV